MGKLHIGDFPAGAGGGGHLSIEDAMNDPALAALLAACRETRDYARRVIAEARLSRINPLHLRPVRPHDNGAQDTERPPDPTS